MTVPYDSSTSVVQFRKACEEQLKVKDQTFKSLALFKPSVDAIDAFNVNHVMLQDPEAFTPIHVLSNIERWIPTSAHRCLKLDLLNGPPPPLSVSSHPVMRLNATNSSKFTHYDLELNHIAWAEHYDDYVKAVKEEAESLRPVTEQVPSSIHAFFWRYSIGLSTTKLWRKSGHVSARPFARTKQQMFLSLNQ